MWYIAKVVFLEVAAVGPVAKLSRARPVAGESDGSVCIEESSHKVVFLPRRINLSIQLPYSVIDHAGNCGHRGVFRGPVAGVVYARVVARPCLVASGRVGVARSRLYSVLPSRGWLTTRPALLDAEYLLER